MDFIDSGIIFCGFVLVIMELRELNKTMRDFVNEVKVEDGPREGT